LGAGITASLTGVSAVGVVGDETDSVEVALTGVGASGETGSLNLQGEVALTGEQASGQTGVINPQGQVAITGVEATGATGTLTASIEPVIIILTDSHEGDKKRKKNWDEEKAKRERRKQELITVYEQLHETRPEIAERIVEPHLTVNIKQPTVNWDALLGDLDRVERLMQEHQEMDDEEVLLLL
jgi:hypothetical protein